MKEGQFSKSNMSNKPCGKSTLASDKTILPDQKCAAKRKDRLMKCSGYIYLAMNRAFRISWENWHVCLFGVGVTVNFEEERIANPHTESYFLC